MKNTILAIDPGTRYWGVSVFHGREIITSMVKNLSTKDSPRNRLQQVRKVLQKILRKYAPDILVIGKVQDFWQDQSPYLARVVEEIRRLAGQNGIKIVQLSPKDVRITLCGNERATRGNLVEVIGREYLDLRDFLVEGLLHKNGTTLGKRVNSLALGLCYLRRGLECAIRRSSRRPARS